MTMHKISYGRVTWIDIIKPTAEDVAFLRSMYPYFHPLNLEDVQSHMERPKIDEDEDYIFLVMHFPFWDAGQLLSRPQEVDLFIGRGYVITIHDGTLKPLQRLRERVLADETERQKFLGRGANHAFYSIIDQLVDYILTKLRKLD
jgi:magnesium transporter